MLAHVPNFIWLGWIGIGGGSIAGPRAAGSHGFVGRGQAQPRTAPAPRRHRGDVTPWIFPALLLRRPRKRVEFRNYEQVIGSSSRHIPT